MGPDEEVMNLSLLMEEQHYRTCVVLGRAAREGDEGRVNLEKNQ